MQNTYDPLFKRINVHIKNSDLIRNVFVHRSYLNEHKDFDLPSNEKLEFLGDSVLSLITSIYLYKNYPKLVEGEYTDIKASIVRMESLAEVGAKIGLGQFLMLSKGEEGNGGRVNTNILADCFEALIAAVFLDNDFEAAYKFVSDFLFAERLDKIIQNKEYLSPKSHLQEVSQDKCKVLPVYTLTQEDGPEHAKAFTVLVSIADKPYGQAQGKSKKQAEENAARLALEKILKE